MATTATADRSAPATGKLSRRLLIVSVVLLVLLNAMYLLFLRAGGTTVQVRPAITDAHIIQAVPLQGQRAVALTANNRVILLADGKPINTYQVDSVVSALATSPDRSTIVVGTSERNVLIFDAQLKPVGQFAINGRVADLDVSDTGKIIVGYGIGQFTGKFWIGQFDKTGAADFKNRTGIDVMSVAAGTQAVYYATADSHVTALTSDGTTLWTTTVPHQPVALAATTDGQLLAGDDRGNMYLLAADGTITWSKQLSQYRIGMVASDPTIGQVLAGDDNRTLFVLNRDTGETIYQSSIAGSVRGLVHSSESSLALLTDTGDWLTLNVAGVANAQRQQLITLLFGAGNLLLVALAATTLVASVPRSRIWAIRSAKQIRKSRTAYLLLLPAFLLIIVFSYVPTVLGLYYSFTNFNLREPIRFIGFDNFVKLSTDRYFWIGFGNMILILVTSVLKSVTMPLLVAELVFWLHGQKLKYWFRTGFVIPSIVPGVVGVLLWKMMYDPNIGLINATLDKLGLSNLQHAWLADEQLAIWAIIFAGFPWIGTFAFLIYLGGLLAINGEIFDSAAIDGASPWTRFRHIELPMIRPQLRLILFFTFIGSIQEYGNIWIFTRGGPGVATYVPGLQMFLQISAAEFGYAAAIGFVLSLIVLFVTVFRFRFNQDPSSV